MTAILEENPSNDALYADDDDELGPGEQLGPDTITEEAPYGYTRDASSPSGWRPKKAPGRPRIPRTAEQLEAEPEPPPPVPDEPPTGAPQPPELTDEDVPMPKGGTIAKKANRLYRRVGRALKSLDHELGAAFIAATRADDEDDITVGEAWENLCKNNIRVRYWVLKGLKGGDIQDLIMVHAPIAAALFLREWLLKRIPVMQAAAAWFAPDDDDQDGDGGRGGPALTEDDLREMADVAEQPARRAGANVTISRLAAKLMDGSADMSDLEHLDPQLVAAAKAMAHKGVPPGFRRQQPKRSSRAKRRH